MHLLGIKGREETFGEFRVDKVPFAHYSQQPLKEVREALADARLQAAKVAYSEYQCARRQKKK